MGSYMPTMLPSHHIGSIIDDNMHANVVEEYAVSLKLVHGMTSTFDPVVNRRGSYLSYADSFAKKEQFESACGRTNLITPDVKQIEMY